MESSKLKLKITYLVTAFDKRAANDRSGLKFLLDENNQVISRIITSNSIEYSEYDYLRQIHAEYLNYDFDFVYKTLCGFRILDNICEVCYITTTFYTPDFYKKGNVYSLNEIQERNILIEEYYGELFAKFGSRSFR